MPRQRERYRDDEGRFTDGRGGDARWEQRGNQDWDYRSGRGETGPRDDRGRFLSEGERGNYYGQRDRNRGEYGRGDYGRGENGPRGDEEWRHGQGDFSDENNYRGGYRRDDYRHNESGRNEPGRYESDDYSRGGQRYEGGRERDEYGRFTSDDDGRFSSGGRDYEDDERDMRRRGAGQDRGRSRFDYDDDHRGRFRNGIPERDDRGRFMSEDDDDGRSGSRGRSRERDERGRFMGDDDDGGRGRGRGGSRSGDHGGWFGDPRGHSQAARLGWRHRQG